MRAIKRFALVLGMSWLLGAAVTQAAPVFSGTLYYTTVISYPSNVWKVAYSYDQGTQILTLGSPVGVTNVPVADGILLAPNGDLLVSGGVSRSAVSVP